MPQASAVGEMNAMAFSKGAAKAALKQVRSLEINGLSFR